MPKHEGTIWRRMFRVWFDDDHAVQIAEEEVSPGWQVRRVGEGGAGRRWNSEKGAQSFGSSPREAMEKFVLYTSAEVGRLEGQAAGLRQEIEKVQQRLAGEVSAAGPAAASPLQAT